MPADQGMIVTRRMDRVIYWSRSLPHIATAVIGGIVLQIDARDAIPEFVRQRIISPIHAAEIRIAAFSGNFERIEDARLGRILEVRHIGMPACFTGSKAADRFSILD